MGYLRLVSLSLMIAAPIWNASGAGGTAVSPVVNSDSIIVFKNPGPAPSYVPCGNEDKFHPCGQVGTYQQANSNIFLQREYIHDHVESLIKMFRDDKSQSSPNFSDLQGKLSDYCPEFNSADDADQAKICLKKYLKWQAQIIDSMQAAMVTNKTNEMMLSTNYQGPMVVEAANKAKLQQIPVPPLIDQKHLDQMKALNTPNLVQLSSEPYQNWSDKLPHAPDKSEFYKWKDVPDPIDPSTKMTILDLDAHGNPKVDDAKYALAIQKYQELVKEFRTTGSPTPVRVKPEQDTVSYETARRYFVGEVNKIVRKESGKFGVGEITYGDAPGTGRSVSSGSGPVISKGPAPTGNHITITVGNNPEDTTKLLSAWYDLLDAP